MQPICFCQRNMQKKSLIGPMTFDISKIIRHVACVSGVKFTSPSVAPSPHVHRFKCISKAKTLCLLSLVSFRKLSVLLDGLMDGWIE